MKIHVLVDITIEGQDPKLPVRMTWNVPSNNAGDNPAFYGEELQKAIDKAYGCVTSSVEEQYGKSSKHVARVEKANDRAKERQDYIEKVQFLKKEGYSNAAIAEQLRIGESTVRSYLKTLKA